MTTAGHSRVDIPFVETPAVLEHETKPDERYETPGGNKVRNDMSTTPEQISTQSAFDLIRRIAGTVKTSQNAAEATQISASLAELDSIIRSLQKTLTELHVENHDLKRQLQAVVDLKTVRKQFRYERSVYWKYDEDGNRVDGPFCPNCLEEDQIRRLTPGAANGLYQCLHHKALFTIAPGGEAVRAAGR